MKKDFDCVELMRSARDDLDKEIESIGLERWVSQAKEKVRHSKLWKRLNKKNPLKKQIPFNN